MSEVPPIEKGASIQESSRQVQIEGLPFLFKETIDEKNKEVSLNLVLPSGAEEKKFNDGIIGYAYASQIPEADLYIEKIQSLSDTLPPESKYHDVQGIGRFLMDNLLSVADMRGWSIAGFPYTNGRLDNSEVAAWMVRKGFTENKGDYMIRPART